jgi:hypothetical protein
MQPVQRWVGRVRVSLKQRAFDHVNTIPIVESDLLLSTSSQRPHELEI